MKKVFSAIMVLAMVCSLSVPAFADDATWTGGTVNADWSDAGNWSAAVPGTGDTATFNALAGGGGPIINLGAGVTVKSITFDTLNATNYTIGSGFPGTQLLTVNDGGAITINNGVTQIETICSAVTLLGNYTFTNNAANTSDLLNFQALITGPAAAGKTLTLNGSNAGENDITAGIVDNGANALAVTKDGTGTWVLSGASTYSGTTTVNAGTLVATNNALALGAGTLTMSGGKLQLADTSDLNFGRNTTITASSEIDSGRVSFAGAGTTQTLGTLSMGAQTLTAGLGDALTTSGTQGLTFGAVTLTGDATITVANTRTAGGGLLTLGAINSSDATDRALTITASGTDDVTVGAIGGTNDLASVTISGNDITMGNIGTAGTSGVTGATAVTAADSGADTGSISLTGTTYTTAGSQTYDAGAAGNVIGLNAGADTTFTTSADNVTFTGTTTLANGSDLVVNTGGSAPGSGDITMGAIRGTSVEDITLNAGSADVSVGAIGNTGASEIRLVTLTGATTTLNGDITTDDDGAAEGDVAINGDVVLGSSVTIDTNGVDTNSGGTVSISGEISAGAAGRDLTINTSSSDNWGGSVTLSTLGDAGGLGSCVNALSITTTGTNGIGPGRASGSISLQATHTAGTQDYNTAGAAGATNGVVTLNGDLTTTDSAVTFAANTPVMLGASVTIDTTDTGFGTGGDVDFEYTLDATTAGMETLGIIAGTGTVTFADAVGGTAALGYLDVSADAINLGCDITSDDTAGEDGHVTMNGATTLTNSITIDTTDGGAGTGGDVNFTNTLDATTAGVETLNITAGTGTVTFADAVGGNTALGSLDVTADAINIGGDIITDDTAGEDGHVTMNGATTLTNSITIDTTDGGAGTGGDVNFTNTLDATTAGVETLNITAGTGTVTFADAVGSNTALGSLDVSADAINLGCDITTDDTAGEDGHVTMNGATTLTNSIVIDTTDGGAGTGGDVNFTNTLDATTAGVETLDIAAGTGTVLFADAVGGTAALGYLHVTADAINLGRDIITDGTAGADGHVTMNGATTLTNSIEIDTTDFGAGTGGDLDFEYTVDATTAGVETLDIAAGTGSVLFADAVGGNTALGYLDVAAAAISLGGDITTDDTAGEDGHIIMNGATTLTAPTTLTSGTGIISLAAVDNGGNLLTINNTGASNATITGVISGDGGLTKDGTGTLTLSGANTYDGVTTVNGGTLKLSGDNSGASGGVTMTAGELDINSATALGTGTLTLNGGTIDNSSAGALTVTTNNAQSWGNNVIFKGTQDLNLGTGAVNLGAATRIVTLSTAGRILTVGGVISGTAADVGLTTNDQGTLTLGGVNTYTGATTIGVGTTLALNATGTIATSSGVANAGTFTIAGNKTVQALTGAGATGLGANTLTIGDANNRSSTYTGVASGTGGITADGTGTLTLGGVNTYTGVTTINTGSKLTLNAAGTIATSSGVANAGTFTIQADKTVQALTGAGTTALGANTLTIGDANNRSCTYDGIIGGTGGITKAGTGTLTLSGANAYTGTTTLNAGTLQATSATALGAGNVVHNAATLDIGANSLNIGGTYAQNGASALMVAINGTAHGMITAGGVCTVNATDSLVLAVSNYVPNNTTYTIIDGAAGGAIVAPVITVTGDNRATFTATTVGDDLILTSSRTANGFASDATPGDSNARAIGTVLDTITNPTADMSNVLATMEGLSNSQVASALDTMVPQVDAGIVNTTTAVLNNFVGASMERVEKLLTIAQGTPSATTGISTGDEGNLNGIWGKGYGSYLTQGTRNNISGYDAWNAGTALGVDHLFGDSFTLGISGGYAYGNVDSDTNNANTYINSAQTTIYGGYADPNIPYFIDAAGSFAYNWYNGQRDISVGGALLRTANAEYGGQQYGVYLGGGYKINVTKNIEFTPLISLQWNHLRMNSYTETEAGALGLNVSSQSYDQLQSGLGARIASPMHFTWGTFTPEAHGKWLYDFIGDPVTMTSNFNGGGAAFGSNGCKPALNSFNAGAQMVFDFKNDISFIANCDTEMKDEFFGIYGSAAVRYSF